MTTDDLRLGAATLPYPTAGGMDARTADTADDVPPAILTGPIGGQPVDADLVFTFSETIQAGSGTVSLRPSLVQADVFSDAITGASVVIAGNTLTLHLPQRLEYETDYTLTFSHGAIQDMAGHTLAGYDTFWHFSSGLSPVAVNLSGTDGDDLLHGSDLADTIAGGAGSDAILGHGGSDLIHGGDEAADVYRGDRIDGGDGDDTLYGDAGNDSLNGGAGNDSLVGGIGDDALDGDIGTDLLDGGAGNDYLSGAAGTASTLRGGDGDDTLYGRDALLDGGNGNDSLSGYDNTTYDGGDGDDTVDIGLMAFNALATHAAGGAGKDRFNLFLAASTNTHLTISGGSGSDTFVFAPPGLTSWNAGARIDVTDFTPGAGGDVIDLGSLLPNNVQGNLFATGLARLVADGRDTLLQVKMDALGGDYWTALDLANIRPTQLTGANFAGGIDPSGSTKGLTLTGTEGNDTLSGLLADDVVNGLGGHDLLYGGPGDDTLDGGAGNDTLYGGIGDDSLAGGAGNDLLLDDDGNNRLLGGAGADALSAGGTGASLLDGGIGNDSLEGGSAADTLLGGDGDDRIGVWNRLLDGPLHAVTVQGGAGADTIRVDNVSMIDAYVTGGTGADTFTFTGVTDRGTVTIADFSAPGGDRLDFLPLLPSELSGNAFGAAGYLKTGQVGSDVVLSLDRDGAAGNQYGYVTAAILKNVALADLPREAFAGGFDVGGSNTGVRIDGSPGMDILTGTFLDDTISGGDGRDYLYGGPGNDLVQGGDESILGNGDGLSGGLGNDTLDGGAGIDALNGDDGDDALLGGAGDDFLQGGLGNDSMFGGAGADHLSDDLGTNLLDGGAGNDTLYAGGGDDTLRGGDGNDVIAVTFDNGRGNRVEADGGDGNDLFEIERTFADADGTVEATGGAGREVYRWSYSALAHDALTILDFQAGAGGDLLDVLSLLRQPDGNPFATGLLRLAESGGDTLLQADLDGPQGPGGFVTVALLKGVAPGALTGDNFSDGIRPDGSPSGLLIEGGNDRDNLRGGLLDDTLRGGDGDDILDGMAGADLLDGGDGNDVLADTHAQHDTLMGGAGNDTLSAIGGDALLDGGAGNDWLSANGGSSLLSGGAGDDVLSAGQGNDTLDGGAGNDILVVGDGFYDTTARRIQVEGGDGDDRIEIALAGTAATEVSLHGGGGRDLFDIGTLPAAAVLTVTDFATGNGGDVIDLSGLNGTLQAQAANPFAPDGTLRVIQRGADAVVQVGDTAHGFADVVTLAGVDKDSLNAANFWHGFNPDGSNHGVALTGGAGDDNLAGGYLDDTLDGGAGNDTLAGGAGNNRLAGGDGDDVVSDRSDGMPFALPSGDDSLSGGAGNDVLHSAGGNDTLDGGAGNDVLWIAGQAISSTLAHPTVVAHGGDGDDQIHVGNYYYASGVSVQLDGGAGRDTFAIDDLSLMQTGAIVITDFTAGAGGDTLDAFGGRAWSGTTPFSGGTYRIVQRDADSVLQFRMVSGYYDIAVLKNVDKTTLVAGNLAGYALDGSTAGQAIDGSPDADTLTGTVLDDTIRGGDGNDAIDGGRGDDSIDGGNGDDTLVGGLGNDTLSGGAGNDLVTAGDGSDLAQGGDGADHLVAASGTATLDGGNGNDLLEVSYAGFYAGDRVTLLGGAGDDVFYFPSNGLGGQKVEATGGGGRDTFELGNAYAVTDFQAGKGGDQIKLSTYYPLAQLSGNPFGDGHLRLLQSGADTLLQFDVDGTGPVQTWTTLLTLKNVQAAAITADNIAGAVNPHPGSPPPPSAPSAPSGPSGPSGPSTPPPSSTPAPPSTPAPTPGQSSTGTGGSDVLTGGAGADSLDGGAGNDVLHGGAGNDVLVGGDGMDSAGYDGKTAAYAITHDGAGWHVRDTAGSDGSDTLQGVERLTFADGAVALDTDGAAGQAYRIYRAAFDRVPDGAGLGFWIAAMDSGTPVQALAAGFVASQEFRDLYGAAPTHAELVGRLYQNVLHRPAEGGGYDYWLAILDKGQASVAQVLAAFSESAENQEGVATLIANGIPYTPYEATAVP